GDRRKSRRLDEANKVGRNGHTDFVPSSQQFAANCSGRLDIAASSVACQSKFHYGYKAGLGISTVGASASSSWRSRVRTDERVPTERSSRLAGRGRTTSGHQNQRPSSAAMVGVMNERTIKVSNISPRPMVVPTWPMLFNATATTE